MQQAFGALVEGPEVRPRLLTTNTGIEGESGHPENAVEWRPDFVAHVGQKLALGHAGSFSRQFGRLQFPCTDSVPRPVAQLLPIRSVQAMALPEQKGTEQKIRQGECVALVPAHPQSRSQRGSQQQNDVEAHQTEFRGERDDAAASQADDPQRGDGKRPILQSIEQNVAEVERAQASGSQRDVSHQHQMEAAMPDRIEVLANRQ